MRTPGKVYPTSLLPGEPKLRHNVVSLAAAALCLLSLPCSASADQTITNCSDGIALKRAFQVGGQLGVINFDCDGTYTVTNTIPITNTNGPIVLDGSDHAITISGSSSTNSGVGLFSIGPGVDLTVINVTFANGQNTNGGALYINSGAIVTLSNCTFIANSAVGTNGSAGANGGNSGTGTGGNGGNGTAGTSAFGGAIYNLGDLTLLYCTLASNNATAGSGGPGGGGGNSGGQLGQGGNGGHGGSGAASAGGAIYHLGANLTVSNCTFTGNTVTGGSGGAGGTNGTGFTAGLAGTGGAGGAASGAGIYSTQTLSVAACTFSYNTVQGGNSADGGSTSSGTGVNGPSGAAALGGGICSLGRATVTKAMTNCTFFNNKVSGGNGGNGGPGTGSLSTGGNGGNGGTASGGGLYSTGSVAVVNCTFANCGAFGGTNGVAGSGAFAGSDGSPGASHGGDIANGAGPFVLINSLLSTNLSGGNGYGTITDGGHNISSDSSLTLAGAGSKKKIDPKIGTLAANGGPTATIALLSGSPAIDAGTNSACPEFDQRGVLRPIGPHCDVGAFEFGLLIQGVITLDIDGSGVSNVTVTAGNQSTTTDQNGNYTLTVSSGTNVVTPSSPSFVFDPESQTVVVTANVNDIDFTASVSSGIAPSITSQPTNQTVAIGSTVTFAVSATGATPLTYQWQFNGTNVPGSINASATNSVFTKSNVQTNDAGLYDVIVANSFGSVTSMVVSLTVGNAGVAPVITLQPTNQTVAIGGSASFAVAAAGTARLFYQWSFNQNAISGATNATYTLNNAQSTNAGTYMATVSNFFGIAGSMGATLTVSNPATQPPTITLQPTNQAIPLGGSVTFFAAAAGAAPLTYQWLFNNSPIAGAAASNYTIPNVAATNAGSYRLVVTNTFGAASSTNATLTVRLPPSIDVQPASQITLVGCGASFNVSASGEGPLSYQWQLNGTKLTAATDATFTVNNVQPGNAGGYAVVVTNSLGQATSQVATLTITNTFLITGQVFDVGGTNGLSGATVAGATAAGGGATTATTDTAGNYTISNVCAGDYFIFASKPGYTFGPAQEVILGPSVSNLDFFASNHLYSISGHVFDSTNGVPVSGVHFSGLGATDANGLYSFSLPAGTYTLVPQPLASYHSFVPTSRTVTVPPDRTNLDFLAGSFKITSIHLTNGTVNLSVVGTFGQDRIEASTNLIDWLSIYTNTNSRLFQFSDTTATNFPQRFYRAVAP